MTMKQLSDTFLVSEKASLDEEIDRLAKLIPQCSNDTYKDYILRAIDHLEEARDCIHIIVIVADQIDKEKK